MAEIERFGALILKQISELSIYLQFVKNKYKICLKGFFLEIRICCALFPDLFNNSTCKTAIFLKAFYCFGCLINYTVIWSNLNKLQSVSPMFTNESRTLSSQCSVYTVVTCTLFSVRTHCLCSSQDYGMCYESAGITNVLFMKHLEGRCQKRLQFIKGKTTLDPRKNNPPI